MWLKCLEMKLLKKKMKFFLSLAILFLSFLFYFIFYYPIPYNIQTIDVETLEWSESEEFLESIKNKAKPVIIKNSPSTKWKALEKWKNDSYLSSLFSSLKLVLNSPVPTMFYYDANRELMKAPRMDWKYNFTILREISTEEFDFPQKERIF